MLSISIFHLLMPKIRWLSSGDEGNWKWARSNDPLLVDTFWGFRQPNNKTANHADFVIKRLSYSGDEGNWKWARSNDRLLVDTFWGFRRPNNKTSNHDDCVVMVLGESINSRDVNNQSIIYVLR
jgi:hypothetical protein